MSPASLEIILLDVLIILVVLLVIILGKWLTRSVLRRGLLSLAKRTKTGLDDMIIKALQPPTYWFLVLFVLEYGINRLSFAPTLYDLLPSIEVNLFHIAYITCGLIALWRLTDGFFGWYIDEIAEKTPTELDLHLFPFLRQVMGVVFIMIGLSIFLGYFGIYLNGILTALGLGSLGVALAARATLEDTISGVMIIIDRPFSIGDRLRIESQNTWGDVLDIGLRSTRLRTRDNRLVIIPNSVIAKNVVVNYSYPDAEYRLESIIKLAYDTDVEIAHRILIEAVQSVEDVLKNRPIDAHLHSFSVKGLEFKVRWWFDTYRDTGDRFDEVNRAMLQAIKDAGISIA